MTETSNAGIMRYSKLGRKPLMTEPWEEAMERVEKEARFGVGEWSSNFDRDFAVLERDLATIRKHIEDLTLQMKVARTDQKQCHAAHEDQAKQLTDLMDANIYQQGRIEELEKALGRLIVEADNIARNGRKSPNGWMPSSASDVSSLLIVTSQVRSAFHPSEPETG
jgi:hypothetical protein